MQNNLSGVVIQNQHLLVCPLCSGSLDVDRSSSSIRCASCQHEYLVDDGVPLLFCQNEWAHKKDVTHDIKAFYEKTPFPDYEDIDSSAMLKQKSEKGLFAKLLDDQIQDHAKVLEVGCGTGQLSNFLGLTWGRTVMGADMCLNSLRLANGFRKDNDIANTGFVQMNLFRPSFKPESFDVVICNGVLHHTSDPFLGFQSILRLVKKGGHIVIGLYHAYSRIPTDVRRSLFRLSNNRLRFLDYRLREKNLGAKKKNSWFMDQYNNPHESKHTFGHALSWFDSCQVDFVNSIPKMRPFQPMSEHEQLFHPKERGTALDRWMVEMGMLLNGDREGGFFIVMGKKRV